MAARVQIPASPLKPAICKGLRDFLLSSSISCYLSKSYPTTPTTTPNKKWGKFFYYPQIHHTPPEEYPDRSPYSPEEKSLRFVFFLFQFVHCIQRVTHFWMSISVEHLCRGPTHHSLCYLRGDFSVYSKCGGSCVSA